MQQTACLLRALLCRASAKSLSGAVLTRASHRQGAAAAVARTHASSVVFEVEGTSASHGSIACRWRAFGTSVAAEPSEGGSPVAGRGIEASRGPDSAGSAAAVNAPARPEGGSSSMLGLSPKSADGLLGQLSPPEQRQLRMLQCEYDALVASGVRMPAHVTDEQWLHCLRERLTKSSRVKYYKYLAIREHYAEQRQQQKEKRQQSQQEAEQKQLEVRQSNLIPGTPYYAEPRNAIFHRIYPRVIKRLDDYRVAYAMQFGQPIIVDMGFGGEMSHKEHSALHTELLFLIGLNRAMREPFHLHLCNVNFDDWSVRIFEKIRHVVRSGDGDGEDEDDAAGNGILPPAAAAAAGNDDRKGWWADHFLMTSTSKCYTELFPKQKLVYLTPNATEVMRTFDPDAVYILGGLVDLGSQGPLSLAKAKKQDIRPMKLPLDYYVKWKLGKKSLGINHVFGILKELAETGGDWRRAIELHAPKRKMDTSWQQAADESDEMQPTKSVVAESAYSRKQRRHSDNDRLSFYRTSPNKQYGHLNKISNGYKHFKKPPTSQQR